MQPLCDKIVKQLLIAIAKLLYHEKESLLLLQMHPCSKSNPNYSCPQFFNCACTDAYFYPGPFFNLILSKEKQNKNVFGLDH